MRKSLAGLTTLSAVVSGAALLSVPVEAAVFPGFSGLKAATATLALTETAQLYVFGGRRYCWYDDGWSGEGWYWCGYQFRRGIGYGGGVGFQGWRRGDDFRRREGNFRRGEGEFRLREGGGEVRRGGGGDLRRGGGDVRGGGEGVAVGPRGGGAAVGPKGGADPGVAGGPRGSSGAVAPRAGGGTTRGAGRAGSGAQSGRESR
jgi:hypothetical protein